jgi:hypothetical protein
LTEEICAMPFVSVTRLRIRSWRFLPGFALHALRSQRQVRKAAGFRTGTLLPDRRWTFWTLTVWDTHEHMRAYMISGAHRVAMPKLLEWCDEASVVHWDSADQSIPPWPDADARMRSEGRPSKVRHPSPDHAAMSFPKPRAMATGVIKPNP